MFKHSFRLTYEVPAMSEVIQHFKSVISCEERVDSKVRQLSELTHFHLDIHSTDNTVATSGGEIYILLHGWRN